MRFETIPAAESRQINGPLWGVRVLTAGAGALVALDQNPVPTAGVLMTVKAPEARPFDRLTMTGPIVLQIAETPDDDLSSQAILAPVVPDPRVQVDRQAIVGPRNLTTTPWVINFLRPAWASGLVIHDRVGINAQTIIGDLYLLDSTGSASALPQAAAFTLPASAGVGTDGCLLVAGRATAPSNGGSGPVETVVLLSAVLGAGGVRLVIRDRTLDAGTLLAFEAMWT